VVPNNAFSHCAVRFEMEAEFAQSATFQRSVASMSNLGSAVGHPPKIALLHGQFRLAGMLPNPLPACILPVFPTVKNQGLTNLSTACAGQSQKLRTLPYICSPKTGLFSLAKNGLESNKTIQLWQALSKKLETGLKVCKAPSKLPRR
jgi:hypothetical protein